jgi:single-strand DNA-binding protein
MASVNKVILIGNLGNQPELRHTSSNRTVTELRIATSDRWTDKEGQRQERTEWHTVVVWGRDAENCERYLSKGRQVYVEGRLQTRNWEDQSGQRRYKTEVVAQVVRFLGGRADASDEAGDPDQRQAPSRNTDKQTAASASPAPGMTDVIHSTSKDDSLDDDIPF